MTNGVNDPPTVVFLFGAGASFGSKDCLPRPPPLGANLFKELRALGGTAAGIDDSLAARFENFEVGMAEFRATRDHELTPFLLEMGHFFSSFEPGPHNYYRKLLEVILKSNLKIVLSTLNYDLLIEHAILHVGRAYCYAQNSGPALSLLKIHGSCNFVPDVPGVFRNLQFSGCQTIIDAPAKPLSIAETRQFYSTEQAFPPVMSLYAKGKNVVSCPKFVETQLRDWGRAIALAREIYVIGVRVNPDDRHVWGELQSAKGALKYVGGAQEFIEWTRLVNRGNAMALAGTFEQALPLVERELQA